MDIVVPDGVIVYRDQEQFGPYGMHDVVAWWQSGDIKDDDLLWMEGMEEWVHVQPFFESNSQLVETEPGEVYEGVEGEQAGEGYVVPGMVDENAIWQAIQRIEGNLEYLVAGVSNIYQSVEALRGEVEGLRGELASEIQDDGEVVHQVQIQDISYPGASEAY